MSQELEQALIFATEVVFAGGISYGSNILQGDNLGECAALVARYIIYLLLFRGFREAVTVGYTWMQKKKSPKWTSLYVRNKSYLALFVLSAGVTAFLQHSKARASSLTEEFIFLLIATLVIRYIDMNQNSCITYGAGMACSFMEGYLTLVLPSDGGSDGGLEDSIRRYESRHGVRLPVRQLLLVVTKSLYCPPDLKEFNKTDPKLAYIEAGESLGDVERDVAGVKRRVYRNSVYKLHRGGARPVYVAAECATPLHTLHRVLQKRAVYDDLLKSIDPEQVGREFCAALQSIIARSPDCRGRCVLVYFDDTDPTQNLADVLLKAIRQIEPNFENII